MSKVVLAGTHAPFIGTALEAQLDADVVAIDLTSGVSRLSTQDRSHLRSADVIVPLASKINRSVLEQANRCQLIQQFGSGTDSVDLEAAHERGIPVCRVPSHLTSNARSVAEHALMMMLMSGRGFQDLDRAVRDGTWSAPLGRTLYDKTVVIVGFGSIGQELARLLAPFGCRVVAVVRDPQKARASGIDPQLCIQLASVSDLVEIVREADVVVLCVPLTTETRGLVDSTVLEALPVTASLVNVARGAVIDELAWQRWCFKDDRGSGALDVFWSEPLSADDYMLNAPRILLTPHSAGLTDAMVHETAEVCATNISCALSGREVRFDVSHATY